MQRLTVRKIPLEDSWKDMARIPAHFRVDSTGKRIHRATICKVTIGDEHKLLVIRGHHEKEPVILLDSHTRGELEVEFDKPYDVTLSPVRWYAFGYWRWAWQASDPSYRIPAQISIISFVLGIVGLFLGLWPIIYGK